MGIWCHLVLETQVDGMVVFQKQMEAMECLHDPSAQ